MVRSAAVVVGMRLLVRGVVDGLHRRSWWPRGHVAALGGKGCPDLAARGREKG